MKIELSLFPLQCILTNRSPRNIPTRHVSPRPWWSQTLTASAPLAPCLQAKRWVLVTSQRTQLDDLFFLFIGNFTLKRNVEIIMLHWKEQQSSKCSAAAELFLHFANGSLQHFLCTFSKLLNSMHVKMKESFFSFWRRENRHNGSTH